MGSTFPRKESFTPHPQTHIWLSGQPETTAQFETTTPLHGEDAPAPEGALPSAGGGVRAIEEVYSIGSDQLLLPGTA